MRWIWIDKFVAFESGRHASAVKNLTLGEEYFDGMLPARSVMPPTLMIEGMAQTAGILVGEARGFAENVVLAKIRKATFEGYGGPGDQLRYDAWMESLDERAAITRGEVSCNGAPIGAIELMFSHVNQSERRLEMPEHNFVFTTQFRALLSSFTDSVKSTGAGA